MRSPHQGEEHHGLALGAIGTHFPGDLVEIGVERGVKVAVFEVPCLNPHAGQIQLQRDSYRLDGAQIALFDGARQGVFISQMLKILAQITHIPTVRGCGYPQDLCRGEMFQNPLVAVSQDMVGFIHHYHVEKIGGELLEALLPHESLHGSDGHPVPAVQAGLLRLFHRAAQPCGGQQLVCRLFQQFAPVGQDQAPPALAHHVLHNLTEHDCLPAPGGQNQERFMKAVRPVLLDCRPGLLLVWPEFHQNLPASQEAAAPAPCPGAGWLSTCFSEMSGASSGS